MLLLQVQSHSPRPGGGSPREHELVYLLKAQLAEAVNLQNKDLVTRLHEVIRCIKLFDADGWVIGNWNNRIHLFWDRHGGLVVKASAS